MQTVPAFQGRTKTINYELDRKQTQASVLSKVLGDEMAINRMSLPVATLDSILPVEERG